MELWWVWKDICGPKINTTKFSLSQLHDDISSQESLFTQDDNMAIFDPYIKAFWKYLEQSPTPPKDLGVSKMNEMQAC